MASERTLRLQQGRDGPELILRTVTEIRVGGLPSGTEEDAHALRATVRGLALALEVAFRDDS